MPNIMITKRCNLSCPYCFANQYVTRASTECDMPLERFQEILDFVLRDGSVRSIGLIGGEPTCHQSFDEFLELLLEERRLDRVTIYTNGVRLAEHLDLMMQEKFFVLINCNSPEQMGIGYPKLLALLSELRGSEWKCHVTLGVNFYDSDFDMSYVLELVELFKPEMLRVSICVPNSGTKEPFEYFEEMKPPILAFFKELLVRGTIPFFDCNIFPACVISVQEMREFERWGEKNPFLRLKTEPLGCLPVIDIMDDFTAIRCFGLSDATRVSIRDFASITDLRNYYLRTVDAYAANTFYASQCAECYKFKTMKCAGGCLIYKMGQIQANRKLVEEQNEKILHYKLYR